MLAYLARDQVPDVNANVARLLLGIFTPSLVQFTTSLTLSVAIVFGAALALVPR